MEDEFRKELRLLINKHSMENGSDTPDFILASYLSACLESFDTAVRLREKWYGRDAKKGLVVESESRQEPQDEVAGVVSGIDDDLKTEGGGS